MGTPIKAPKKSGPKGPRKPLEERVNLQRQKLADLEMKLKVKQDPEKLKLYREIRALSKRPQTPVIASAIKELRAQL